MHKINIPQSAIDRVLSRRDTLHIFTDLNPVRTAHVIVDLQNGFMAPGQPAEIAAARDIIPNVNRISDAVRTAGGINVFIQNTIDIDSRQTWSTWFDSMSNAERAGCMAAAFTEGSFGHALWPDLTVLPNDLKVKKSRFGAFVPGSSGLHDILQARNIDTLIITGTATNVCCESTARDAMMMNYRVIFVSDGTATHNDEEHNAALGIILSHFADVMNADEVLACLAKPVSRSLE